MCWSVTEAVSAQCTASQHGHIMGYCCLHTHLGTWQHACCWMLLALILTPLCFMRALTGMLRAAAAAARSCLESRSQVGAGALGAQTCNIGCISFKLAARHRTHQWHGWVGNLRSHCVDVLPVLARCAERQQAALLCSEVSTPAYTCMVTLWMAPSCSLWLLEVCYDSYS